MNYTTFYDLFPSESIETYTIDDTFSSDLEDKNITYPIDAQGRAISIKDGFKSI